jgi:biotin operon repressor
MHAARLETSERLQRVLWLLLDGQWHSTRDVIRRAHVCSVNSCIAELRANGLDIECRAHAGHYEYRLRAAPPGVASALGERAILRG